MALTIALAKLKRCFPLYFIVMLGKNTIFLDFVADLKPRANRFSMLTKQQNNVLSVFQTALHDAKLPLDSPLKQAGNNTLELFHE